MIRGYQPADLPVLMEIGNRAWAGIYTEFRRIYGDELFTVIVPDPATVKGEQIRAHCEAHPDWVLVAEDEGRVQGFVTFRLDRERGIGEIGNNAVAPELQGQGIAQHLYQAAFARFRAEGMRFAKVVTGMDPAHAPARRAYERAGFDLRREDAVYHRKL